MSRPTPRSRSKDVALEPAKKRRLKWTCRYCDHSFSTWTRRGLHITCPKCHRIQEGPEGLRRLLPEGQKKKPPARRSAAKTVAIVKAESKLVALPKKAAPARRAAPAARAAQAAPAQPASTPSPQRGLFSRVIFGG